MSNDKFEENPDDIRNALTNDFVALYGESDAPIRTFFAPGRVNLIGDHIDYHGGLVFPCAINLGTTLLVRQTADKPGDNRLQLASTNFEFSASIAEQQWDQKVEDQWVNYPLAVLQQFRAETPGSIAKPLQTTPTKITGGLQCLYHGNLPHGAGLSSSASIEMVTAFALNTVFQVGLNLPQLAQLCQRAENDFVGVQCGIMDQFACAIGEQGKAMRLSCADLQYEQVPLHLGEHQILLINSNQSRELSDSNYNERVSETNTALTLLQTALSAAQLTDITPRQLEDHKALFSQLPLLFQRARHVVNEQARVLQAVEVLQSGDIKEFGRLMFASHDSLDQDYAVSSEPLNLLVQLAREDDNVIGARLTGAGFGGCTVNIVKRAGLTQFCQQVATRYKTDTGLEAAFFSVSAANGVQEITNSGSREQH